MSERELWIGLVHLRPSTPQDWSAFDGWENYRAAGAYSNIITWASDAREFRLQMEKVAADSKLYVVDIENEEPLANRDRSTLDDGLKENARRAESNPNATIFGTFHSYSRDDA